MRGCPSGFQRGGDANATEGWQTHPARLASRRKTLSRETDGDMRCRTPDAPAPGAAGTTRPPVDLRLLLATLLPTWARFSIGGRRCERAHHRADRVTQRQPRTLSRHSTHCSCCLGLPSARRSSRRPIRAQVLAAAARRQTCTAGASTILGDDWNADATERHATQRQGASMEGLGTLLRHWNANERGTGGRKLATPLTDAERGTDLPSSITAS